MLLERAAGLKSAITKCEKIRTDADKAEQFQTRAKLFRGVAKRITRARNILSSFANAGVAFDFVPSNAVGYATKARTLRAAISEDSAKINNPPFDLKHEFTDRITGIADAAEKAMATAWEAHVEKCASFEFNDMLNALVEVPQFRANVSKLRQCRADITALGNTLPSDPLSAVARLNSLVADHKAAWKDLSADDIPSTVLAFIRDSANEGAPLWTYTDEVRSWLKRRNLLKTFRIRLGRNAW